jgi:hypothetical protein
MAGEINEIKMLRKEIDRWPIFNNRYTISALMKETKEIGSRGPQWV